MTEQERQADLRAREASELARAADNTQPSATRGDPASNPDSEAAIETGGPADTSVEAEAIAVGVNLLASGEGRGAAASGGTDTESTTLDAAAETSSEAERGGGSSSDADFSSPIFAFGSSPLQPPEEFKT